MIALITVLLDEDFSLVGIPITGVASALGVMVILLLGALGLLWKKIGKLEDLIAQKEAEKDEVQNARTADNQSMLREVLVVQGKLDNVLTGLGDKIGASNEALRDLKASLDRLVDSNR